MQLLVANNAVSALAFGISPTATTCALQAGTGALFPNPAPGQYFAITLASAASGGFLREIVYVTARSGDTITTMLRGQEGTTQQGFLAGDFAWNRFTAGAALAFAQIPAFNGADPNGFAAGVQASTYGAASLVFSTPNDTLWICTLSGPASSAIWVPISGLRKRVTPTVFNIYVAPTPLGNDNNDGLSSLTPFATLQHAWTYMLGGLDLNVKTIICNVADGTYAQSLAASGVLLGQGDATTVIFRGNTTNPQNCLLTGDGIHDIFRISGFGTALSLAGFTLGTLDAPTGNCISSEFGAMVYFDRTIFGQTRNNHLFASANAVLVAGVPSILQSGGGGADIGGGASYVIQGDAAAHQVSTYSSVCSVNRASVAIYHNPTFSDAFAHAAINSTVQNMLNVYTGTASGRQWIATVNGVVYTNNEPADYLPGSIPGQASFGGFYY